MKNVRILEGWLTIILLFATGIASITVYIFWYPLTFFVGDYLFIHWIGIITTFFVMVSIPTHYIIKRRRPQIYGKVLKIHTLGNLFSFLLISLHFSQNLGRLAGALQRLGTGFTLYLVLLLIVATGIQERHKTNSKFSRLIKTIHKYSAIALYLVALIHLLSGFNIL